MEEKILDEPIRPIDISIFTSPVFFIMYHEGDKNTEVDEDAET